LQNDKSGGIIALPIEENPSKDNEVIMRFEKPDVVHHFTRDERGRLRPLILRGRPGVGKTGFLSTIMGRNTPLIRVPMGPKSFEDFGSYPIPVREARMVTKVNDAGVPVLVDGKETQEERTIARVEQALSEVSIEPFLAHNIGDGYGVILFDDVTSAGDPRVQSALLDIVQFGNIAGLPIGRNVLIAMSGNNIEDNSQAVEWSQALLQRADVYDFEPNFDTWVMLPDNEKIEPVIVAFLQDYPEFFAPIVGDEKTSDEGGKTPSPREWTAIGLSLIEVGGYRNYYPSLLAPDVTQFMASKIGMKSAAAVATYARNYEIYPTGKELFDDVTTWNKVPKERRMQLSGALSVVYALRNHATGLISAALEEKKPKDKLAVITKTLLDRTRVVAEDNMEVIAFVMRSLMNWADDPEHKKRKALLVAMADVISSPEYQGDKEFYDFIKVFGEFKGVKR
jgi:hypothetical protein